MAALTFAAEVVLLRQQLLQVLMVLKTELRPISQQGSFSNKLSSFYLYNFAEAWSRQYTATSHFKMATAGN